MIIVETNLKSIETEMVLLEQLKSGEDTLDFVLGALTALQWVVQGGDLPSTFTRMMQVNRSRPQ